jgi:hypothetical protein
MDDTRMVSQLPPLEPGETEVAAFASSAAGPSPAPASLLSAKSEVHNRVSTLRVNVTTMGKDHSLQRGQVELQLASMDAEVATAVTWTKTIRRFQGQVKEHEASCRDGTFRCDGDAVWCVEQKKIVCQEIPMEDAAQLALQPAESLTIAGHAKIDHQNDLAFMQRRSHLQGHLK